MRKLSDFKAEKEALRFWSFLSKMKIESNLEKKDDGNGWEIWIPDEDQLGQALMHYREFADKPDDSKFNSEPRALPVNESFSRKGKRQFREYNLRERWQSREKNPGLFTLALIITSVAVFLVSGMGQNTEIVGSFFISEKLDGRLSEFTSGQVWRVITPIFLHLGPFHLLFNMFWLYELGSQIERKKGSKFFLTFLVFIAIFSNLTQFTFSGPNFGGMSGVIYGLFGYVWIKSRLDPGDGFLIDPTVAMVMFGFFLICFTGVFGGVANWAHAGGLVVGLAWGYGSAFRWNLGSR
jgi:GlpG protein